MRILRVIEMLALGVLLIAGAAVSSAQPGDGAVEEVTTPAGISAAAGSDEVKLSVRSFGVGNRVRAGDWAGIEIGVEDTFAGSSERARNIVLRLAITDPDGDTAWMERPIVSNRDARQSVWMYAFLPFGISMNAEIEITAHVAVKRDDGVLTYSAGDRLGQTRFQIRGQVIPSHAGLLGVAGPNRAGLDQYLWPQQSNFSRDYPITGHEPVEIISGLTPSDLPDRWMGLMSMDAVVWTGATPQDQPTMLSGALQDRGQALREWVRRGGHLIVVLPPAGQTWVGTPANPLSDIVPAVRIRRMEGVDLDRYRQLLTRDRKVTLPDNAVVQAFERLPGASEQDAFPIMEGPDGEIVVVRRQVGEGAVTLVGIDVASRRLGDVQDAFQADQFWNRVLGRRRPLYRPEVLKDRMTGQSPWYQQTAVATDFDSFIAAEIAQSASAAAGVLMAFVLFVGYWLLAGPLGYFILKQRGWKQHAWVGFVATAGLFTAVAWGGANLLKVRRVQGQHFSIVDGVYGQTTQRARSWVSVFLPSYGDERIAIAREAGPGAEDWHNAIAAWAPPESAGGGGGFGAFPDARGYPVDTRRPDIMDVPSRATTKELQLDWAGALPPSWAMIRPVADPSVPIGKEIRLIDRPDARGGERKWLIDGTLTHGLPGALENVHVIVVERPTSPGLAPGGGESMPMIAWAIRRPSDAPWKPGEAFALEGPDPKQWERAGRLLADLRGRAGSLGAIAAQSVTDLRRAIPALSLFSMLEPPPQISVDNNRIAARRQCTHGWDLDRWFTQPCVIVVGVLSDQGCPVPISVDNLSPEVTRARLKGKTVVRWVYPLGPQPLKAEVLATSAAAPDAGAPSEGDSARPSPGGGE